MQERHRTVFKIIVYIALAALLFTALAPILATTN